MTTGTPTVNSLAAAYEILALCCTAGFAAYDLRHRRVPGKALALFCPIALMAPFAHASPPQDWGTLAGSFSLSLAGAATGFFIPLAAAMASKDGMGIGGGDIKLAAAMGFIYGPYRMLAILLAASLSACATALATCRLWQGKVLSLPFVPFLAAGSLAVALAAI